MKHVTEAQAKMLRGLVRQEEGAVDDRLAWAQSMLKWSVDDPADYCPMGSSERPEALAKLIVSNERRIAKLASLKKALGGTE